MPKIVANGEVKIYTESFGKAEDTAVLLISGAMAPALFWEDSFCQALSSQGYHVIRFDNRDMGKSTHFPQSAPDSGIELPYSIGDMVEDARVVLEAHSTDPGHIIGHSLGGSIAQLFAISYPEKTLSLTAISCPILARGGLPFIETDPAVTEALWKVLMANPMHQDFEKGAPEFLKVWRCLNGGWELDEAMANKYTKAIYETEVIGPAWNHTKIQDGIRDILKEMENINKPMLFIHGEKDFLPSNPHNTKLLARHLTGAHVFILKNGGHMFFNKQIWVILFDRIYRFFNGS